MKPEVPYEAAEALQRVTWKSGLVAVGVLLAFLAVAKLAGWLVRRALTRGTGWGGPIFALSKLLTYFVVFIGVVVALSLLGVPLSSLLLTSSALLVGVGFSLQPVARDFIAGVIILVEQPIRKNDFVTFGETAGTVQEIGLRATHLRTVEGADVVVPNHLLVTAEVSNHSHPLKRACVFVEVPVATGEDVDLVDETLAGVARRHPQVLSEPPPLVRFDAILASHFKFTMVVWVDEPPQTLQVASELRFAIAHAFAREGLQFPKPEMIFQAHPREPEHPDQHGSR